ncbi:MAG: DUF294 nucleotidyltransferase-like domain-containing protein [Bauldia sp.]
MSDSIERARTFSEMRLSDLRGSISSVVPAECMVLTCGSFARREASPSSDLDYSIIAAEEHAGPWVETVKAKFAEVVAVAPASGGAFAGVEAPARMVTNVGGENDTNRNITHRMLFLLEGEWIFNKAGLRGLRRQILERYIAETMTDHQLALFLLNDIIRYYRTMAVDYEFKTSEAESPKPWGIRNIKLVFSRKLLYTSGLFSVALTADRDWCAKIAILEGLFDLPVIDRMVEICGRSRMRAVLQSYAVFLDKMEDSGVRARLKGLKPDDRDDRKDPVFRALKNEGHKFTRELLKLFETTFDSTHPIRRAVIF